MYASNFVFSQLMPHLPRHTFRRCVAHYRGHYKVKAFSCLDQFLILANANQTRDWRICADFAQALIHTARRLYLDEDFGIELKHTVYALDATTIDLSQSVFP